MNHTRVLPVPQAIALGPSLQARITPTVDARTGGFAGFDLRLYRLAGGVQGLDGYHPTQAGLKVPGKCARALGEALIAMASELGE